MLNRIFLIVLDSLGAGEAPDAAAYGDEGSHTLRAISTRPGFAIPNLRALGIGNINGLSFLGPVPKPIAAHGRLREVSAGKDTTTGHFEISGVVMNAPLPTYPDGFPDEIIAEFSRQVGRGVLCNKPASGTAVIAEYGEEHLRTGDLIVYTSADSVFQIAAHESIVPPEQLYAYCRIARKILVGEHGVGRVIARPFIGEPGNFTRTPRRHDFSIEPPETTMLDMLSEAGLETIGVGKINDIFAGRGISRTTSTTSNADGLAKTMALADEDWRGICFVNLVDFDSAYGHRNDADGYARALTEFDTWLGEFLPKLGAGDCLMITADHGCDPSTPSIDHSREYTPLLIAGPGIAPTQLGTQDGFYRIAATVASGFGIAHKWGEPLLDLSAEPSDAQRLVEAATEAMGRAYAPYSHFKVGAALLDTDGRIWQGCNIENASYSPTICAERAAIASAVASGVRKFAAIAIVGGHAGEIEGICAPCGVCRQVLSEFCPASMPVYLGKKDGWMTLTVGALLPLSFMLNESEG